MSENTNISNKRKKWTETCFFFFEFSLLQIFNTKEKIQNLIKKILTDLHVREFGLKIQFEAIFFEINVTDEL